LLSHLRIRYKLVLQRVVSLLPAVLATYLLVQVIQGEGVDRSRYELEGLQYTDALQALAQQVQQARAGALATGIDPAAAALEPLAAPLAPVLGSVAAQRQPITNAARALGDGGTPRAADADALIARVLGHLQDVAAAIGFDDDPQVVLLAQAALQEAPLLDERLARQRFAPRGTLDPLIGDSTARLRQTLVRAISPDDADDALRRTLDELTQAGSEPVALQRALGGVRLAVHDRLAERVTARGARAQERIWKTIGAVVALVALSAILGLAIEHNITQPLGAIVSMATHIADGDLSVAVTPQARRDEFGDLQRSCRRMIDSLTAMAAAADQMAAGNLGVAVQPVSTRDQLGNALLGTVRELSTLVGQVQKSGIQVAGSINQIAATAKQQQAMAGEVAATTTEVGATSREIAVTARDLQAAVGDVAKVAEESARLAGSGQAGLGQMGATLDQVMASAGTITTRLGVLNGKAANISQVVTTISKVADQTNLLSLNAAIEAEKAGEYGRGFAVVATEIRRLADQTAVATYDIDKMVQEIQSAVSSCVMGMDSFSEEVRRGLREMRSTSEQLTGIIRAVQELAPRFEQVSEGVRAQTIGAEQINEAIDQLNDAARQTAESLRQSREAIDGLQDVSITLRDSVSRFRLQTG
jgi:methyl-accepting chemotaxis protein